MPYRCIRSVGPLHRRAAAPARRYAVVARRRSLLSSASFTARRTFMRLNGPQTTGREYRNLSEPRHESRRENNVAIAMRDGTRLLADVHRPDADGRFPALIAASPS